jgi:hypothetical protein
MAGGALATEGQPSIATSTRGSHAKQRANVFVRKFSRQAVRFADDMTMSHSGNKAAIASTVCVDRVMR